MATERRDSEFPGLTERQGAFLRNLVRGMSAAEAAREAGYSARSAAQTASRMLRKDNIQAALATLRERAEAEAIAEHVECCKAATEIIRAHLTAVIESDGTIDISRLPELKRALKKFRLQVVDLPEGGQRTTTEIELHDPLKAIERLAKLRGYDARERHLVEHQGEEEHVVRFVYETPEGGTIEEVMQDD